MTENMTYCETEVVVDDDGWFAGTHRPKRGEEVLANVQGRLMVLEYQGECFATDGSGKYHDWGTVLQWRYPERYQHSMSPPPSLSDVPPSEFPEIEAIRCGRKCLSIAERGQLLRVVEDAIEEFGAFEMGLHIGRWCSGRAGALEPEGCKAYEERAYRDIAERVYVAFDPGRVIPGMRIRQAPGREVKRRQLKGACSATAVLLTDVGHTSERWQIIGNLDWIDWTLNGIGLTKFLRLLAVLCSDLSEHATATDRPDAAVRWARSASDLDGVCDARNEDLDRSAP